MEAAFIPPIPDLEYFGYGQYHLLLSHLCKDSKAYRDHYRVERRVNKAHLILDNSAHEFGSGQAAQVLIDQAVDLQAQEIVAPDTLFNAEKTLKGATDAYAVFAESEEFQKLHPRIMLVPQGKPLEAWVWCLSELWTLHDFYSWKHPKVFHQIPVIGVSKDYEVFEGGLYRLLEEHLLLGLSQEAMVVHFLGWSSKLWTIDRIARDYGSIPNLRSIDSAKPFVYARAGIILDPRKPPPVYPKRPKQYFKTPLPMKFHPLAYWNCRVFEAAAAGKLQEICKKLDSGQMRLPEVS